MAKKGTLSLHDLVEITPLCVCVFVHLEVRGLLSFVGVVTLKAVNLNAGLMVWLGVPHAVNDGVAFLEQARLAELSFTVSRGVVLTVHALQVSPVRIKSVLTRATSTSE